MVGRQHFARKGLILSVMYFYFHATNAVTSLWLGRYTELWIGICCKQCTDNMFRHYRFSHSVNNTRLHFEHPTVASDTFPCAVCYLTQALLKPWGTKGALLQQGLIYGCRQIRRDMYHILLYSVHPLEPTFLYVKGLKSQLGSQHRLLEKRIKKSLLLLLLLHHRYYYCHNQS